MHRFATTLGVVGALAALSGCGSPCNVTARGGQGDLMRVTCSDGSSVEITSVGGEPPDTTHTLVGSALEFPTLKRASIVSISGDGSTSGSTVKNVSFPALTSVTSFIGAFGPAPANVTAPELTAGSVQLSGGGTGLRSFTATALVTADTLSVANSSVSEVLLGHLKTITEKLEIVGNPNLATLDLSSLTTVNANPTISDNAQLKQCAVDKIKTQVTTTVTWTMSGNAGTPNTCP